MAKPRTEQKDWDFDGLMNAASSFSHRVAEYPWKTWAILTRYDTVPSFISRAWEPQPRIQLMQYNNIQGYTANILDMHMEYKSIVTYINNIIPRPDKYNVSKSTDAVAATIEVLVEERAKVKRQMNMIVKEIERLNKCRAKEKDGAKTNLLAPEIWRARLPTLREEFTDKYTTEKETEVLLKGLPLIEDSRLGPQSIPMSGLSSGKAPLVIPSNPATEGNSTVRVLYSYAARLHLLSKEERFTIPEEAEKDFVLSRESSELYPQCDFSPPRGHDQIKCASGRPPRAAPSPAFD